MAYEIPGMNRRPSLVAPAERYTNARRAAARARNAAMEMQSRPAAPPTRGVRPGAPAEPTPLTRQPPTSIGGFDFGGGGGGFRTAVEPGSFGVPDEPGVPRSGFGTPAPVAPPRPALPAPALPAPTGPVPAPPMGGSATPPSAPPSGLPYHAQPVAPPPMLGTDDFGRGGDLWGGYERIDPNNDLRSRIIAAEFNPRYEGEMEDLIRQSELQRFGAVAGPDFSGARGHLGAAGADIDSARMGDFRSIAGGTYDPSGESVESRQLAMQALRRVMGGPDRAQLANQALELFDESSDPAYQQRLRGVGQKAAALGRVGAGMTTNELTDVFTTRERDRDRLKRGLALETAQQELGDRFGRLSAATGAGGQFRGEDLAEAGFRQGLRMEDRGERDSEMAARARRAALALQRAGARQGLAGAEAGMAGQEYGARFSERGFQADQDRLRSDNAFRRAGFLGDMDQTRFGREGMLRDELRGERTYQTQQAQTGLDNRIRQLQLEEQMRQADWARRFAQSNAQAQYGYGGNDPSGAYAADAERRAAAARAAAEAAARAGAGYGARRAGGATQSSPPQGYNPEFEDWMNTGRFPTNDLGWRR